MCGIFAYVGHRPAEPLLIEGIRRLEYRGYDSAGLATLRSNQLHLRKCAGRLAQLVEHLQQRPAPGDQGIAHTRWATHGPATDVNAHPHVSRDGRVAVVHNGVIENYLKLRRQLQQEGIVFRSETDTEVIAELIARCLSGDLLTAISKALSLVQGSYALAVVSPQCPGLLIGARLGSPLVLGLGRDENFLASDISALGGMSDHAHYLEDHQLALLGPGNVQIVDQGQMPISLQARPIVREASSVERGDFPHFMLKEIYEQPTALEKTLSGRLRGDDADFRADNPDFDRLRLENVERLILTGCGTSFHAGQVGEYLIESIARLPVEVEYASEFRYRQRPIDRNTLVVAITQSGETADTLAALRACQQDGYPVLALYNVAGSSITREADACIDLRAGPEIGVASSKAFTAQVLVLTLLALHLARQRGLSSERGAAAVEQIRAVPTLVQQALGCQEQVRRIARRYHRMSNCLYLGRQFLYPVALEGALKLKEISYVHAEGYPAAEMKHGPIALVDSQTPSVFLSPRGAVYDKVMSNLEEIKARGGPVIAVACEGDTEALERADATIAIPHVPDYLQPLIAVVPLQLFAYHVALLRGCDVDKPRNLAKSVTVE